MADMTLEQVRDWHLHCAKHRTGHADGTFHHACANVIDSALKARSEPVAWMATCMGPIYACEVFRTRKEAEECGDGWDHCHITPLYAAPPADDRPTWEEVREMVALGSARRTNECQNPKYRADYDLADRIIAEFRKETSDKFAAGLTCANRVTAGDT